MSHGPSQPVNRPVLIALCLMLACVAVAVVGAAAAHAAEYKMVACSSNNGTAPYTLSTNTTSGSNPGGIFEFDNWCGGAGGDPPGESAYMRIVENQPSGNAGNGAYGDFYFDTPAFVHFKQAGGYTRQPNAFNEGWRARFWYAGPWGSGQLMTQGAGLCNCSGQWGTTGSFAPHLWPGGNADFTRFVYELECVRQAGCDRSNYNATDLNGMVFILSDDSPSQVGFTTTNSLMAGAWVRGGQTATWNSSDQGSGLRSERLRVDGSQIDEVNYAGVCNTNWTPANGEWARAFQPCPTGGPFGRAFGFDTASIADGAHNLQVCAQDFAQYQHLNAGPQETCDARTIHTDNTAPGAPSGLFVNSANPQRYMDHFTAQFSLPPNQGSPIAAVHYNVVNAAGEVVQPEQTLSGTDPTQVAIAGPKAPGDYRLRVWLQDGVGLSGPATTAPIPRDTTPPAAPQGIAVAAPSTTRSADGFDVSWHNLVDAGAPIDAVHYQVLNGAGAVVVPTQTAYADNVQAIGNLETPNDRGNFSLRLWLSDAEGNAGAPVAAPLAYDCMRSPAKGGQQLTASFGDAGDKTVQQGEGASITGDLRGTGGDIAGAPLCVYSNVVTDAERQFLGIAITGSSGGYRFAIAPGASRKVTVLYRPDARQQSAGATLQTRVHPTLKTPAQVVRNKHFAHFEGDIPGPHNDQVVIVLQVKSGNGWLAFRRYRTRNDGHFELEYRFRRTTRPTTYEMRAQVRETTGYPYLEGDSDPLILRVVPGRAKPSGKGARHAKHRCAKGRRTVKHRGKTRCAAKPHKRHRGGSHQGGGA